MHERIYALYFTYMSVKTYWTKYRNEHAPKKSNKNISLTQIQQGQFNLIFVFFKSAKQQV
jgi:hypothetical protein